MLLALDTATPLVTVALHDGRDVVVEHVSEQPMRHGEQLVPLVQRVLDEAGVTRAALTGVAAGVGPGPFTGLRVGLVTARTLAWSLDLPVHGVCTLDVLAVEAVATGALPEGVERFVVATDARRKEVYLATYDATGARLDGPVVERPDTVATDLPAVGGGAALYPDAFRHPVGPDRPSAGWLARAVHGRLVAVGDLEPLYLRRPDAVAPGPRKPAS